MLVTCPKCGFQQPQDQYCANCGVDMVRFRPKNNSALSRFLSIVPVQISLVVAAALVGSFLFIKNQENNQKIRTTSLNSRINSGTKNRLSVTPASTFASLSSEVKSGSVQVDTLDENQKKLLAGESTSNSTLALPSSAANSADPQNEMTRPSLTESTQTKTQASIKKILMRISYYEISHTLLEDWIRYNQKPTLNSTSQEPVFGLLTHLDLKQIAQIPSLKTDTLQVNNEAAVENASGHFFDKTRPKETYRAIVYTARLKNLSSQEVEVALDAKKRGFVGDELTTVNLKIKKDTAGFVYWPTMMHGFENQTYLLRVPPFNILASPSWKAQQSHLILVVEPYF